MQNFLSNSKKQCIGIALTPGIGLEAVVLDKNDSTVINYGRKKVEYNFSTREIQDYAQFKTALSELVSDLRIPPKTSVYFILPNIQFDFIEIPNIVDSTQIKTAILSNAEEFYVFKKDEPVSGWSEVANRGSAQRRLAYSSFQKKAIDQIREIFADAGLSLAGIENHYSATLRGLYKTGYIDDVVAGDMPWTAMIIGINSYCLLHSEGKNLLEYSEVPLALKSFSMEEAYQAIVSSSSQMLSNFESSKLYIISQTDDICAEVLKRQMQFDRDIVAIDSNIKYAKKPLLEVLSSTTQDFNEVNSITLAAIAASIAKNDYGLILNILADDPNASMGVYFSTNLMGSEVDVTFDFVRNICIAIAIVVGLILGAVYAGVKTYADSLQAEVDSVKNQVKKVEAEIKALEDKKPKEKKPEIDMTQIIDDVAAVNVAAIRFYDSISTDIPKNVWLTRYYNKDGNSIVVKGIAQSIVDIYEYYKNLRIVSPQSDLKLNDLKVVTQSSDSEESGYLNGLAIDRENDRLYSFEISNTAMPAQPRADAKTPGGKGGAPDNEDTIISRPTTPPPAPVEEVSKQMTPAKKKRKKK